jgi:hypothetical protein
VWFAICESQEVKQTESGEKSINVRVASRTWLGMVVQPDNSSGVFCTTTWFIVPVGLVNVVIVKLKAI